MASSCLLEASLRRGNERLGCSASASHSADTFLDARGVLRGSIEGGLVTSVVLDSEAGKSSSEWFGRTPNTYSQPALACGQCISCVSCN